MDYEQEQLKRVKALEGRIASRDATTKERIELALLYWEPCRREDDAMTILEEILASEPACSEAAFWLGYLYNHYGGMYRAELSPQARITLYDKTALMLRRIIDDDREWGPAARIVLSYTLQLRNEELGVPHTPESTALLETVVRERPDWVNNRLLLADAYLRAARYREALEQVRQAKANSLGTDICYQMDVITYAFETYITGRCAAGGLADDLEKRIVCKYRERIG